MNAAIEEEMKISKWHFFVMSVISRILKIKIIQLD